MSQAWPRQLSVAALLCAAMLGIVEWAPTPVAGVVLAQPDPAAHPGFPLPEFSTGHFAGSGVCAWCHSRLLDLSGTDISFDTDWRSTMMAQSARDPLWQAKVSAEVARTPSLRETIEAKCATCHTPIAYAEARRTGQHVSLLDGGFLDAAHTLHEAALDGVSCTLCHQIQSTDLGTPVSFSGGFRLDPTTVRPGRAAFGPFPAPLVTQMRNVAGFTPAQGLHTLDADLCATCHTLYTPVVNADGDVVGTFPEQTPFLEWRHSVFGDGAGEDWSCQRCHMPAPTAAAVIANRPGGRQLGARQPIGQHHFVGGNRAMLGVLGQKVGELQLTASTAEFAATAARTVDQLQTRTAAVAIADVARHGDTLTVVVDMRNLAGHKFPTGFPSRRAWLHVTVSDATGRTVFESGRPDAEGRVTGCDADEGSGRFEPHYDLIVDAGEVQIYEAVMHDTTGAVTHTLLRAAGYAKDNRLLPEGFVAATAPDDVAVRGRAAADASFDGGGDRVTYQLDIPGALGPLAVEVALRYQTVSHAFLRDLRETATPHVSRFAAMYDEADREPTVVARARISVP